MVHSFGKVTEETFILSDSSFFSHSDPGSSTVVTANTDPFVKLPVLGNTDGKQK